MSNTRLETIFQRAERYERKRVAQGFCITSDDDYAGEWCDYHIEKELARFNNDHRECHWGHEILDCCWRHDKPARCNKCGRRLYGCLTQWGADKIIEKFRLRRFNIQSEEDCYLWTLCEESLLKYSEEYHLLLRIAGINSNAEAM